jgi:chromate reductase, NAD(P)H dehydrogenase (quinone)
LRSLRILAISGSLRAASSNTALLRAATMLPCAGVEVRLYDGLAQLPPFNPDLDIEPDGDGAEQLLPPPVRDLRAQVAAADGLLIACPEYAHGVPGAFKNALDWLVGDLDFAGKPVALLNAAPRAHHAQASLAETLRTMAACLVTEPPIGVPVRNRALDAEAILSDPSLVSALRAAIDALACEITRRATASDA